MNYKMADGKIAQKVLGGAGGGITVGPFLAVIVLYILQSVMHQNLPVEVASAITGLIMWGVTVGSAYLTPPSKEDVTVPTS